MTNELEKQFFETFGIEPKLTFYNLIKVKENDTTEYSTRCSANYNNESKEETIRRHSSNGWKVLECKYVYTYPQITDRILLELICLCPDLDNVFFTDVEKLKETLLNSYIKIYKYYTEVERLSDCEKELKHQVRTLFEEER